VTQITPQRGQLLNSTGLLTFDGPPRSDDKAISGRFVPTIRSAVTAPAGGSANPVCSAGAVRTLGAPFARSRGSLVELCWSRFTFIAVDDTT
jgi:hypothetical protein